MVLVWSRATNIFAEFSDFEVLMAFNFVLYLKHGFRASITKMRFSGCKKKERPWNPGTLYNRFVINRSVPVVPFLLWASRRWSPRQQRCQEEKTTYAGSIIS